VLTLSIDFNTIQNHRILTTTEARVSPFLMPPAVGEWVRLLDLSDTNECQGMIEHVDGRWLTIRVEPSTWRSNDPIRILHSFDEWEAEVGEWEAVVA
jgi:hypothetical protein